MRDEVQLWLDELDPTGRRVPLATRLMAEELVGRRAEWPRNELVEALTALLARSAEDAEDLRQALYRVSKPSSGARTPPPERPQRLPEPVEEPPPIEPPRKRRAGLLWVIVAFWLWSAFDLRQVPSVEEPPRDKPSQPSECRQPPICGPRPMKADGPPFTRYVGGPQPDPHPERYAVALSLLGALVAGGLTYWAWRTGRMPEPLPPPGDGPATFIFPTPEGWPPLLSTDEKARLGWGAGRYTAEEPGERLDVPATIDATVRAGGLPTFVFAQEAQERSIWILDDVTDTSPLRRPLIREMISELSAVGVPHRVWTFDLRREAIQDPRTGEQLSLDELEDGARARAVVVVSDGQSVLQGSSISLRGQVGLRPLAALHRLVWVDPGRGVHLSRALEALGIRVLYPEALPRWLEKGAVEEPRPSVATHPIDLWAGLCHRFDWFSAPGPRLAVALAADLGLREVRPLFVSALFGRSPSPLQLQLGSEREKLRTYAKAAHPKLWREAATWWTQPLRRVEEEDSPAGEEARVGQALIKLQALSEGESCSEHELRAAAATLYAASRQHAEVRWRLRGLSPGDRASLPEKARRELSAIENRTRAEPSPVSLRLRLARGGALGVALAGALQAGHLIWNPPPLPKELVPVVFIRVPGGEGCIGSPSCEKDRHSDEGLRRVRLSAFSMAETETTREAFEAWRAAGGKAQAPREAPDDHPAAAVTWDEARRFCQSLGEGFDLPSEAQWEFAARAGTTTAYFFGNSAEALDEYAWYYSNSNDKSHPARSKKPNPLGFYGLYGNLYEWVLDTYESRASDDLDQVVTGISDRPVGAFRVLRGGSFVFPARILRSAIRDGNQPGLRFRSRGFRCAGPSSPSSTLAF